MAAIVHPWPVTPMKRASPCARASTSGLQRPARSHRLLPVVGMAEGVELDQVDVVDAEPLERAVDVLARLARRPLAGLGRQEEVAPVTRHPRPDAQLGVAVPRGGVDVIDAVA